MRRVLICGHGEGVQELCARLVHRVGSLELTVMLGSDDERQALEAAFLDISPVSKTGDGEPRAPHFALVRPGELRTTTPDGETVVRITIGDPSRHRDLATGGGAFQLGEQDAIVLRPLHGDADPDAVTALTLLRLEDLRKSGELRSDARIVCEIESAEKAELLQSRFGGLQNDGRGLGATIVASQRLRHATLAQAVLVPGIVPIFDDLLSGREASLCRLAWRERPSDAVPMRFSEIAHALFAHCGAIAIALEKEAHGRRSIFLPPRRGTGSRTDLRDISAIFAICDPSRFSRST